MSALPYLALSQLNLATTLSGVEVDSETIERPFAEALERDARVKLYVKLPGWFKVPTPVTAYNPDWAIVVDLGDGKDRLCLVRETTPADVKQLRRDERRKIECGRKHFADTLGQDFKVVGDVSQHL
ncbi:restriction endonuclease [Rhizobium sp. SG_E_25_P2]|uniref:restriction endonuclease n=1 Tax=Rhizobium sp. SG_E_25_P2 TaxID=2879942 RepID=UPI002472E908|nr:hypothetical protein [Rhizobium sp. SG_E_25_P2]MDH6265357.1 restriction endonuclease [Rhizobium sp. SG_E_25_P2]